MFSCTQNHELTSSSISARFTTAYRGSEVHQKKMWRRLDDTSTSWREDDEIEDGDNGMIGNVARPARLHLAVERVKGGSGCCRLQIKAALLEDVGRGLLP